MWHLLFVYLGAGVTAGMYDTSEAKEATGRDAELICALS